MRNLSSKSPSFVWSNFEQQKEKRNRKNSYFRLRYLWDLSQTDNFSLLFTVVPLIFSSGKHSNSNSLGTWVTQILRLKGYKRQKLLFVSRENCKDFLSVSLVPPIKGQFFPKFGLDHPSTSQIEVIPFKCWAFKLIPLNCSTTSNCLLLQAIWKGVYSVSKYQLQVLNWSNLSSIFGIVFMATLGQQFLGS